MLTVEQERRIKSGEFTFCSRCGRICHIGPEEFVCTQCQSWVHSLPQRGQQFAEYLLKVNAERDLSDRTKKYRQDLALMRIKYV